MKKKLLLLLTIILSCLWLTSCDNKNDTVEIYNKNYYILDNIKIKVKDGYFYDKHEKFTVNDNTIGVTIYFSTTETWDDKTND